MARLSVATAGGRDGKPPQEESWWQGLAASNKEGAGSQS
jgi:hypothetical protein